MAATTAKTADKQSPIADLKFETAITELENIVRSMEGNTNDALDLEASIAAYQRGMALLKHCQNQLADAEQRIEVLSASNLNETSA